MQIDIVAREAWQAVTRAPEALLALTESGGAMIIRDFMPANIIDHFRAECEALSKAQAPSWHPLHDGCPDYHRQHENYPDAYVPSVQHAFYFHPWNARFSELLAFDGFAEIFALKSRLAGPQANGYLTNLPSTGPVARIVCHHYVQGGGGQAEHTDPVSPFAKIQTLIQASTPSEDYREGGLYVNDSTLGIIPLDRLTQKGDLILLSPGVRHGVAPIDPQAPRDWANPKGRWMIMPIILHSDYVTDAATKPQKLGTLA